MFVANVRESAALYCTTSRPPYAPKAEDIGLGLHARSSASSPSSAYCQARLRRSIPGKQLPAVAQQAIPK